jgi:hypothetical protein
MAMQRNPAVADGHNLMPAVTPWAVNSSRVGVTGLEAILRERMS